jgi:hypothetical protein
MEYTHCSKAFCAAIHVSLILMFTETEVFWDVMLCSTPHIYPH